MFATAPQALAFATPLRAPWQSGARPRTVATCVRMSTADVKGSARNPYKVAILSGDGVGPRVATAAQQVLDALAGCADIHFEYVPALYGADAFESCGKLVPSETVDICRSVDAVLRSYQGIARGEGRAGNAHLQLRDELGLFAQLRPVLIYPALAASSPLRPDVASNVDLMLVREISGGALGAVAMSEEDVETTSTTVSYTSEEINRIASIAWELAAARSGRLLNVDKADAMAVSRFWRRTISSRFDALKKDNDGIQIDNMFVDDFMRELILRPADFDVVITSNLFGDVLAEAMSALAGPQRATPSAWVNADGLGVYGPADIYNTEAYPSADEPASPLALIRAASMMLRYTLDEPAAADLIQQALRKIMSDVATPGVPRTNGAVLPAVEPEVYAEYVVRALESDRQYETMCAPTECGE